MVSSVPNLCLSFNDSFVIAIKPRATENVCIDAMYSVRVPFNV